MAEKSKLWYRSKTVWAAGAVAGVAVLQSFGVQVPNELYALLGALGLYGIRTADKKIE